MGGLLALRGRRMDRSLLLWAGARGGRGAAPRHRPLRPVLWLGDFAWELRNHRLEQLLREPLSAAARGHRLLTAAEGSCPPPPQRPGKDFIPSLRVVICTLECPLQEDSRAYRHLPDSFPKHLQDALFPPWTIGRGSMTAWEARLDFLNSGK